MNADRERYLTSNDKASRRARKNFYETRMDRLKESMKNAKSEKELIRFKKLKNGTLDKVGKYRGKTYNS